LIGRYDLTGKWPGWPGRRVWQQYLIAPGGTMRHGCIAEHVMRHIVQTWDWEWREISRKQLALF
jgi:hypothetical protein